MSTKTDNLPLQLQQFGLSEEEVMVYIEALEKGRISALKLSRNLGLARTKIYRLIDKLLEKGLIQEEVKDYGKKFIAAKPERFLQMVNEQERELLLLKATAPTIINQLKKISPTKGQEPKILHYSGVEGLKQITWNSLQAKGTLRIFEMDTMDTFLEFGFSEKARQEFVNRKIKVREISNTKVFEPWTKVSKFAKDYWTPRYVDPKDMKMEFEIMIYNDVYAMYEYRNKEIFCVEVHNKSLAKMQKQLFDYVWRDAKEMELIGAQGAAKLKQQ